MPIKTNASEQFHRSALVSDAGSWLSFRSLSCSREELQQNLLGKWLNDVRLYEDESLDLTEGKSQILFTLMVFFCRSSSPFAYKMFRYLVLFLQLVLLSVGCKMANLQCFKYYFIYPQSNEVNFLFRLLLMSSLKQERSRPHCFLSNALKHFFAYLECFKTLCLIFLLRYL